MTKEDLDTLCAAMDIAGSARGRAAGFYLALLELEHNSHDTAMVRIREMYENEKLREAKLAKEADEMLRKLSSTPEVETLVDIRDQLAAAMHAGFDALAAQDVGELIATIDAFHDLSKKAFGHHVARIEKRMEMLGNEKVWEWLPVAMTQWVSARRTAKDALRNASEDPSWKMQSGAYQAALASTQTAWHKVA